MSRSVTTSRRGRGRSTVPSDGRGRYGSDADAVAVSTDSAEADGGRLTADDPAMTVLETFLGGSAMDRSTSSPNGPPATAASPGAPATDVGDRSCGLGHSGPDRRSPGA